MELKEICSSTFYYRQVAAGLVLAAVTATSQGAMASDPQAAHLAQCKSELQALYGPETRLRMIKAKSYRGIHNMKFKVYPPNQDLTVVECVSDEAAEQGIVLMSTAGDVLTS